MEVWKLPRSNLPKLPTYLHDKLVLSLGDPAAKVEVSDETSSFMKRVMVDLEMCVSTSWYLNLIFIQRSSEMM